MTAAPQLPAAVDAFVRDMVAVPGLAETCTRTQGIVPERFSPWVRAEAFVVAAAFVDADGTMTDAELTALLGTFEEIIRLSGQDMGGWTPADIRAAGKLVGIHHSLDEPTSLQRAVADNDRAHGTNHMATYFDRAIAVGHAAALLDGSVSDVEARCVERLRATLTALVSTAPHVPSAASPDPVVAAAVVDFHEELVPLCEGLRERQGLPREGVSQGVAGEAFLLAAAFAEADGVISDAEAWTIIALFTEVADALEDPMGATPDELRATGRLTGARELLTAPTDVRSLLAETDRRDGTSHLQTYWGLASAIGYAVAALDASTSDAEVRAIEDLRQSLLALGDGTTALTSTAGTPAPAPAGAAGDDAPRPLDELLAELDGLIGLDGVKAEVRLVTNLLQVQGVRRQRGLPVMEQSRHLVFTGNPGTGKTTVARLLAQIYRTLGVVQRGHLVETDRSGLVAGYVGQTATKVTEVVDSADEGVLLIDEAYALARADGGNDFGMEAVDTLVKLIEDRRDRLVVIMAGYPDEMARLLESNPGMGSRFPKTIAFADYDTDDLVAIFTSMGKANGYQCDDGAAASVRAWFEAQDRGKGFGNGRTARNLFEAAVANHATRLVSVADATDAQLTTLTAADIPPLAPAP